MWVRSLLEVQMLYKTYKICFFSQDTLTIYDGGSNTSHLLGEFCADTVPSTQVSSGNQFYLHFETDPFVNGHGFKLEYTAYSK